MVTWSIDKRDWGEGPWIDEPDRVEWRHRDLPCLIVRSDATGALCGYVGVPPGHPWCGRGYDEIEASAHGGLTYSNACDPGGPICHEPAPGEPDEVWWVGFDCSHAYDVSPKIEALVGWANHRRFGPRVAYRDIAYVTGVVNDLADQALGATAQGPS